MGELLQATTRLPMSPVKDHLQYLESMMRSGGGNWSMGAPVPLAFERCVRSTWLPGCCSLGPCADLGSLHLVLSLFSLSEVVS